MRKNFGAKTILYPMPVLIIGTYDENGTISQIDGKYILNAVLTFNTPSGASDFILGGSTNGWMEWKNKEGKTLDELYRQ